MLKLTPHTGLDESYNHALRTEDVRFSPSGRVLAVVATSGDICLFAVDIASRPIRVNRSTVLHSASLASPHGIDFLNEHVVVVANRGGWLTFYRLPGVNTWKGNMTVEPIHEFGSTWFGGKGSTRQVNGRSVNCGPGSVRVVDRQLFVCCNNKSTLTAHPFTLKREKVVVSDGEVVVHDGLEIPDGLALSRDGRWLAVGDHEYRCIMIMRRRTNQVLSCKLRDADLSHPHGICFDPTGKALYVADAGERSMHVFVSQDEWATNMDGSTFKLPAVLADAFNKTKESVDQKYRSLEGGIKGVDVDASGRIIATTCQNQMLRFFESDFAPAEKGGKSFWQVLTASFGR
jgi:sugar lactone lactonase YvrE